MGRDCNFVWSALLLVDSFAVEWTNPRQAVASFAHRVQRNAAAGRCSGACTAADRGYGPAGGCNMLSQSAVAGANRPGDWNGRSKPRSHCNGIGYNYFYHAGAVYTEPPYAA